MDSPSGNISPIKNTIRKARRELNSSPLKFRKRRKSSIPLQLVEFINQIKPDSASKQSYKGEYTNKNHLRKMINKSIPEESENSSIIENKNNNKKEKKEKKEKKIKNEKREKKDKNNEKSERKDKKDKKNEIENNNYYIHYIKNVYENESHLNKDNLFKSANKNNNINETLMNFLESNKNIKPVFKRRNSAMNKELFKSNLVNKHLLLDKIQINSKLPESIINKKKSQDIILHKKKDVKEKENAKSHLYNTSGNKNKSKNKNKDKKKYKDKNKTKEKDKNKDSNEENNINTENQKKNVKEKEILENEKKTETENNIENTKIKKINKFKKFLCCFINNGDDSIEND